MAPSNVEWLLELAVLLYRLALLGDEPRPRLERALEIVRRLDAEGKLKPEQKAWPAAVEQALANLPK